MKTIYFHSSWIPGDTQTRERRPAPGSPNLIPKEKSGPCRPQDSEIPMTSHSMRPEIFLPTTLIWNGILGWPGTDLPESAMPSAVENLDGLPATANFRQPGLITCLG